MVRRFPGLSPKSYPLAVSLNPCYIGDMDTQEKETRITIRFPADVIAVLRQLAKEHDRSLNGEIVRALREYIEKYRGK